MLAMLCFGPLEISFLFFYQLKMVGVGFNYTNPIICSLYGFFFRIKLLYKLKLKMLYESF